jgi:ABC-2 type transport system ATP-binding protein
VIVETVGLRKSFGSQRVLDGVDLQVPEATVLALLGPNGAGKTTAVRILTTLSRPDSGVAKVAGYDVISQPSAVRAAISLTGQFVAVDDEQTGRENLVMLARLRHLGRYGARLRSDELLERFDLTDAGDRRVRTYSGGMRRRLDLAMSLVAAPRVIFLDEPTTGLDPPSRSTMWDAIGDLVRQGSTIVLTTQYLEEADRLADRIALLANGRIVAAGTADDLKAKVGGDRLELRFATADELGRAAAALAHRSVQVTAPTRLQLPTDGSAGELHHVLDDLRAGGVRAERATSHRPTLDDAFRVLTASNLPDGGSR